MPSHSYSTSLKASLTMKLAISWAYLQTPPPHAFPAPNAYSRNTTTASTRKLSETRRSEDPSYEQHQPLSITRRPSASHPCPGRAWSPCLRHHPPVHGRPKRRDP